MQQIKCNSCSALVEGDSRFCRYCGTQLQSVVVQTKTKPILFPFRQDDLWGFCGDNPNIMLIPCGFDYVFPFIDGFATVSKEEKWGLINDQGEIIIPFHYAYPLFFKEGYAKVMKDEKWSFVDVFGRQLTDFVYDLAEDFEGEYARVLNGVSSISAV
jgi:hypothetical protein